MALLLKPLCLAMARVGVSFCSSESTAARTWASAAQMEHSFRMAGPTLPKKSAMRNLQRRNLTKGQQAMALAMIYPEPEKGGRGKNSSLSKGFSNARLSQARTARELLRLATKYDAMQVVDCGTVFRKYFRVMLGLSTTTAQPTLRAEPAPSQVSPEQELRDRLHALDRELSALAAEQAVFFKEHFKFCASIGMRGRLMILARDLKESGEIQKAWQEFQPRRLKIERQRSRVLHELAVLKFPNLAEGVR